MSYIICILVILFFALFAFGSCFLSKEEKEHREEIKKLKEQEIEKEEIKNNIDLNSHVDSINNMLDLLSKRKK